MDTLREFQIKGLVANSILDIGGLTRIVVIHSLDGEVLKRYNGIIVLKVGRVVEMGHFDELMKRREFFYSLYKVSHIKYHSKGA